MKFTVTTNCEYSIEVEADSIKEAIQKARVIPIEDEEWREAWAEYDAEIEIMGLPRIDDGGGQPIWMAYNHNDTPLMKEPGTKEEAEKEATDYTWATNNASYVKKMEG